MVELLSWALPLSRVSVSAGNVTLLLPLAVELDIPMLLEDCTRYYEDLLKSSENNEDHVAFLSIPQCTTLQQAYDMAVQHLALQTMEDLEALKSFTELPPEVSSRIVLARVKLFERGSLKNGQVVPEAKVTLVVEDREIEVPVAAHLSVSPVFKAMMANAFKESDTHTIYLPGKSYDAVKLMVDFICSPDHVDVRGNLLEKCLALADEYMLGCMRQACEEFMLLHCEKIPLNKQLMYLRLAKTYDMPCVIEKIIELCRNKGTKDFSACEDSNLAYAAPVLLGVT